MNFLLCQIQGCVLLGCDGNCCRWYFAIVIISVAGWPMSKCKHINCWFLRRLRGSANTATILMPKFSETHSIVGFAYFKKTAVHVLACNQWTRSFLPRPNFFCFEWKLRKFCLNSDFFESLHVLKVFLKANLGTALLESVSCCKRNSLAASFLRTSVFLAAITVATSFSDGESDRIGKGEEPSHK